MMGTCGQMMANFMSFGLEGQSLFWLGGLAVLAWLLTRMPLNPYGRNGTTAIDILHRRFAAGEIGEDEFERARELLRSPRTH